MLYKRWLDVVRAHPDRFALWDGVAGRRYTFNELAQRAGDQPTADGPIRFVRGTGAGFILSVLAAWRDRQMLVPLEGGQPEPAISTPPGVGIVHLKTTSATAGAARMIAFTAGQLAADCENVVTTMGLDPALPNVGAISLTHSYGFSNLVLPLLLKGVPLLLADSALPESVRVAIDQAEAVAVPSVPALWRAWHDAGILSRRIRLGISAGAPLPLALEQEVFEAAGIKIHNFYGSSECGGIAYDDTLVPRREPAQAGRPMRNVALEINEAGCVVVRSQAVGQGYWPEPDPVLANGVFQSGDLGELIDGALHLRGRASDCINVAGRKVNPEDVERVLCSHPGIRDCVVFGVPSDTPRNETIVACLVAGVEVSTRALSDFLQTRLPAWQVPRDWWRVEVLDTSPRGKRSRADWRQRYLQGRQG
ncbi:MAG: fatty acid--CoA ligase family protein [Verrucomicrobia bacterium]|jgi:acyl-CoA synthetase (AMP-forming)/AMP-acid ligase II|nr:fatty acid--CoA ligase family protein [Verrucomicrobiota bacterium]